VLAGDALFQFQSITSNFAPAKEFAAPAAAPTVVARQEVPPAEVGVPVLPEEALDEEAEGATYTEVAPSPLPGEETRALAAMPTPTAAADRGGGGPPARDEATATPLATPAPRVDKAQATGTPLPSVAIEAPVEEAPQAPPVSAAAPMATPQPEMTATSVPAAPLALPSAAPSATPTPMVVATATATATPVPTATPLSVAKAPAGVHATEEKGALAEPSARPQAPGLTLLRVVEVSLCLLVVVLIAATLIVRRRIKT
jgi:hypothetical protein